MKEKGNAFFIPLRCVSVACVFILGFITIVGTGGGETSFSLTISAFAVSPTSVSLSWNGSVFSPSRFDVYVDNTFYASFQVNSTTVTELDPDTRYCFKVYIVDPSVGITERSNVTCETTLPDSSPTTPARSASNAVSPRSISLSQVPSSHDFEIGGDCIHRKGACAECLSGTPPSEAQLSPVADRFNTESAYKAPGNDPPVMNQDRTLTGWTIRAVDSEGSAGAYNAIAIDSMDNVHIAYYERNQGGSRLELATWVYGVWRVDIMDNLGDLGAYISMSIDSRDDIHMSYFDKTSGTLKYATNASGISTTETVDSSKTAGYNASIKVDSAGKVHISYLDPTHRALKYATNASGVWDMYIIDSVDMVGDGANTAICLDSADKIHIGYYDGGVEAFQLDRSVLKVATNTSGTWDGRIIDRESHLGGFASMAVDSADRVHISYLDSAKQALKYATNASGVWAKSIIDTVGGEAAGTSIAVDATDRVHIGYLDGTNHALKYATNASGTWDIGTIVTGANTKGGVSIAVDATGKVHISYHGVDGLRYATNR
jgi:hypothetical protein